MEPHLGDRIQIKKLELDARIGVTNEERAKPQRLTINITVWPKTGFADLEDNIDRTINYVELCRAARQLVEAREWMLIETVASKMASHLVATFNLTAAEVEVRKFVLPKTKYVSATARLSATR